MMRTSLAVLCSILAGMVACRAEPLAVIHDQAPAECVQVQPAFSFDGARLAWVERRGYLDSYIHVVEMGLHKSRRLPDQGSASDFCWSSGGDVLAHVDTPWRPRAADVTLGIVDLEIGPMAELPIDAARARHLIWRGDAIQLALLDTDPAGAPMGWYLARLLPNSGQVEFLTGPIDLTLLPESAGEAAFGWSPEGNVAALIDTAGVPSLHVWEEGLPDFLPDNYLPGLDLKLLQIASPAIGPEGREIFFAAARMHEPRSTAIWRYRRLEGSAETVLEFPDGDEWPVCMAVSPDGARLAVLVGRNDTGERGGDVAILRVTGLTDEPDWGEREIELGEDAILRVRWWRNIEPSMTWSPDGESLAYSIGGQVRLARIGTQADLCITHVKQVVMAMLMFATDWDDALPGPVQVAYLKERNPRSQPIEGPDWWTALVDPYIRDSDILRCPLMGEGEGSGYVYPEHLWGRTTQGIENPSKTILLMDDQPCHNGSRVVGFADGHVKLMREEDIARLLKDAQP